MKSKRAKVHLEENNSGPFSRELYIDDAVKAVELAEADARSRAVMAFEYWAHKYAEDADEVYSLADFMEYYDDDDLSI